MIRNKKMEGGGGGVVGGRKEKKEKVTKKEKRGKICKLRSKEKNMGASGCTSTRKNKRKGKLQ